MKIFLVALFLLSAVSISVQAQDYFEPDTEEELPQKKVFFGGNFGASFGSDAFFVTISPIIGYRVAPKVSIGGGVIYQYISREFRPINQPVVRINSHNYGFRAFTNYKLNSFVFATVELENQSVELLTNNSETIREWVPGFMMGLGAYQPIGNKALGVSMLYNFLHDDFRSPYNSALIIRFGIVM